MQFKNDTSFADQTGEFSALDEYEFVSYEEVDFGQKAEIERLLKKVRNQLCSKGTQPPLVAVPSATNCFRDQCQQKSIHLHVHVHVAQLCRTSRACSHLE